jgi:hypothetical protein
MQKYKCIEWFDLALCDENGVLLEDEAMEVEVGTIWYLDESGDFLRLLPVDNRDEWIAIYNPRVLEMSFEKID